MSIGKKFLFSLLLCSIFLISLGRANLAKKSQVIAAAAKLPCVVLSDYFYFKNDIKKSLIFDSLYLATDVVDTALKMYHREKNIHFLEIVFVFYHMVSFITKMVELKNLDNESDIKKEEISEEINSKEDNENLNKNNLKRRFFYNFLKYGSLLSDSVFSVGFAYTKNDEIASWISSLGVWQKIFIDCVNNRDFKFDSNSFAVFSLIFGFLWTILDGNEIFEETRSFNFNKSQQFNNIPKNIIIYDYRVKKSRHFMKNFGKNGFKYLSMIPIGRKNDDFENVDEITVLPMYKDAEGNCYYE